MKASQSHAVPVRACPNVPCGHASHAWQLEDGLLRCPSDCTIRMQAEKWRKEHERERAALVAELEREEKRGRFRSQALGRVA